MQKLGILASILLLTAAIIGPVGFSHAQTVDTNKESKMKHDEMRAKMDQERADRLEAQKQRAAEIKEMMAAKKAAAAKELEAMLAERNAKIANDEIPRAADILAALKAKAADAIAAKKATPGPSKVQKALEQDREAFAKKVEEHKMKLPTTPAKDVKYVKDDKRDRPDTLKKMGATDQKSKEELSVKEQKKAEEIKKEKLDAIHYNRK